MTRAEPVSSHRLVDTEFDAVVIGGGPGAHAAAWHGSSSGFVRPHYSSLKSVTQL